MHLKNIHHRWTKEEYPPQGHVSIPEERFAHDEYGCDLFLLVYGRSHPTIATQGGRFDEAVWEYEVVHDKSEGDAPQKLVGLNINIQINGSLDNDNEPPNNSWAGLRLDLDVIAPSPASIFSFVQFSNNGQLIPVNEPFTIKPLEVSPQGLRLQLRSARNVLIDHQESSWANHKSEIKISLKPFLYNPFLERPGEAAIKRCS